MKSGAELLSHLNERNECIVSDVDQSNVLKAISNPSNSPELKQRIIREILLQTSAYGPVITEATLSAIGKLDRYHEFIPDLLMFMKEEVSHPSLARKGASKLGGEVPETHTATMNPPTFAVAAVCQRIALHCKPFAFLGYLYLLEGTTAPIATKFYQTLLSSGVDEDFLRVHAEEDENHTRYLGEVILRITSRVGEAADAILQGYDYFAAVYPLPVWEYCLSKCDNGK